MFVQYNNNSNQMSQVVYSDFTGSRSALTIKQVPSRFEPYILADRLIDVEDGASSALVKVRVHYAAVNPVDCKMRKGYFKLFCHGKRVGFEFSGTVTKCFRALYGSRFKCGDRVCGMLPMHQVGALSEYLHVPDSWLVKVPHAMTLKEACTVPMACLTADLMTKRTLGQCGRDSSKLPSLKVLVLGGNTSVGRMAIQMIRVYDPSCVIYATMKRHHAFIDEFHVKVIDYTNGAWWEQIPHDRDFDATSKFTLILDTVGGEDNWLHGKDYLARGGEYSTCVGDRQTAFTVGEMLTRGVHVLARNGVATYSQVVCSGGDAEPLIFYMSRVTGNPGREYGFTDEGVRDAMAEVENPDKLGKPIVCLVQPEL